MPQFRNRKSEEYAQLRQAVENLQLAVDMLSNGVAETRKSAMGANLSAHAVQSKLDKLEEEEKHAAKPWRVLRLTLLCVILLGLAGFLTYTGVKGFADPLASPTGADSIGFAVQVSTPTAAQVQAGPPDSIPMYLWATYSPADGKDTDYQITVPAKYAGKRYVLLLAGTARIDQPSAPTLPFVHDPPLQSRSTNCTYPLLGMPQITRITEQCQLITGRFPAEANTYMPDADSCQLGAGGSVGSWTPNAVMVEFVGTSQVTTASDWAYQQYSLPDIAGLVEPANYLARWNGIPLAGWYATGRMAACRVDQLPESVELSDTYNPAMQSVDGTLLWRGTNGLERAAFVVRRRDADEIANALLAAGAAMAALAIGFIPVAYDADRERRRARSQRHLPRR